MLRPLRLPLIAMAATALLAGLHAGLQRIGAISISDTGELALWHGPLMVAGFFATLIGLERAVAHGARWLYAAPVLSGAAGLFLLAGADASQAAFLAAVGAAILAMGAATAVRQHPEMFMTVLAAGTFALLVANLLWLIDGLSPAVAFWWAGFLLLVVAGERLELSRVLQHGRFVNGLFLAAAAGLVAGLGLLLIDERLGHLLLGVALLALAAWLLVFDVARRTIRGRGPTRYMAAALLAGYAWLGLAGILLMLPDPFAGFGYDAILHALFVGFAFSMVFAHAAVIFPAVIGVAMPYTRLFYVPLVLLHGSLALRIGADASELASERGLAGALNGGAILLFFLLLASAAAAAHHHRVRTRSHASEGLPS